MRNLALLLASAVLGLTALCTVGFASPPQAKASSLTSREIREMTIKAKLEVGPSYSTL